MFRKSAWIAIRGASLVKSTQLRDKTIHLLSIVHTENPSTLNNNFTGASRCFSLTSTHWKDATDDTKDTIIDADRERRQKILTLEIDVARQDGHRAPDPATITPEHWEQILNLPTASARRKYYNYLWKIEIKKESEKIKKEKRQEKLSALREEWAKQDKTHIQYHLGANTMFLRVYDSTIDKFNNHKLIRAIQWGQKLVIDCSYDKHMVTREAKNAAKQIMLLFADNRLDDDPYDLHFTGATMDGVTMKELHKFIPRMMEPSFPMNIHTESYLDLFPKEKLVYLTPHCRNDLTHFSHDDIYIVGAMVDKMNNEPLSLAKAKSEGLRMARLPLDHYLQWGGGSGKSLTINQMLLILLDIKNTGDWATALRHVPRRKLQEFRSQLPMKQKLEKFRDYQFNFETWGAKKLVDHSPKRVEKRLKQKVRISEIFET